MARVGGRSTVAAWVVGLICVGVVGALAVIALPLLPVGIGLLGGSQPTSAATTDGDDDGAQGGVPVECRDLYPAELWASLVRADDSLLNENRELPTSSASGLVDALQPTVRFTCTWTSAEGTISTTLADVPSDAGAIATTALPTEGFTCVDVDGRTRCTLTAAGADSDADAERTETIETGGGLWLSTVLESWHPDGYAERTAEAVWPAEATEG